MVQASEKASEQVVARDLVDALYTTVRRAHRLRTARVHSSCDKAGLVLLGLLHEQGAMRLSDLAAAAQLDPSTVSRQVHALCQGDFATALEDPADKRARRLQITAKGRAEVDAVAAELADVLGEAVRSWPKKDVQALTGLLVKLADDLAHDANDARHNRAI